MKEGECFTALSPPFMHSSLCSQPHYLTRKVSLIQRQRISSLPILVRRCSPLARRLGTDWVEGQGSSTADTAETGSCSCSLEEEAHMGHSHIISTQLWTQSKSKYLNPLILPSGGVGSSTADTETGSCSLVLLQSRGGPYVPLSNKSSI